MRVFCVLSPVLQWFGPWVTVCRQYGSPYGRASTVRGMSSSHLGVGSRVGTREKGRVRARSVNALDIELVRFLVRFKFARGYQLAAWTGASPWTVSNRLQFLGKAGLIDRWTATASLVGKDHKVRRTTVSVMSATPKGARMVEGWVVPGTGGQVVAMKPGKASPALADHTLGVSDLAAWYRMVGFGVAAEREIISLERANKLPDQPERELGVYWTVPKGGVHNHVPDMGVVHPDGSMWGVELELAVKPIQDYVATVGAYLSAGMGQVWHVRSQATGRRLMEACRRHAVQWAEDRGDGASVSRDGMVRLQGWRPGRSGLGAAGTWKGQLPVVPPARFDVPTPWPDPSVTWRTGEVVDFEAADGGEW